jgi:hypothetical protein
MQLLGNLGIMSFVRISLWNWIAHVILRDSKRKVCQVFKNNPQGIEKESDQKQLL